MNWRKTPTSLVLISRLKISAIVSSADLQAIAKTYGSAHSPGDVTVLVPQDRVVLVQACALHRMPPIFGDTDTALWIESFDHFVDEVADWIIVPGHGGVI